MTDLEAEAAATGDVVDLVIAAQAGDEEALAALLSAHLPLVYNIIGRALHGHSDVDDVVQETMLRVIRGLPGLREPDRFRSWLIAIGYRQVQMYLRDRQKVLRRTMEIPPEQTEASADFAEQTLSELVLAAQRRELTEAARWLDGDDRRLLADWWRVVLGEITLADVAGTLDVHARLASMRVRRMKAQLDGARGVVRALQAAPRCPELAHLMHGWNGVPNSVWRKRFTRHVRGCGRCGRHRRELIPPERLLLGVVALPGITGADAAGTTVHTVWTAIQNFLANKLVAGAAAVTVTAGGGFAYAVHETPEPPSRPQAIVQPDIGVSGAARRSSAPTAPGAAPAPSATAVGVGVGVSAAQIFVAPDGSDGGTGTAGSPFATLAKAVAVVRPGQTIALRGGTYQLTASVVISTSGTAKQRITLSNYAGERPVLDAARLPANQWAVIHQAGYWTVQGLEIKNSLGHAYVCRACRYDVFQRLSIHDNARSGLTLRDAGTIGNQVLDSDFFNNADPAERGRVGIGLGFNDGAGDGNVVRDNRAFNNADNGFDVGDFAGSVTLENNWAYGNGVNRWNVEGWQSNADGFHLGGGNPPPAAAHVLRNNAAWDNAYAGFSTSGNRGALRLSNNTAFRNGRDGFYLIDAITATVTGNASVGNGGAAATVAADVAARGNTWQGGEDGPGLFRSTDPTAAQGPRTAKGRLPLVDFLVTGAGIGATMTAR